MTTSTLPGPVTMTREIAAQLRAPFEPYEIGKLPKITCPACSKKNCNEHSKSRCGICSSWITEKHIHLDYVGHAEITDRLLQVDPEWEWEPLAWDARGLPLFDEDGGLWIRLTVAGKRRLGYGDAEGKKGPSAKKEVIGDALRNAAMRFGVGLDLWGAKHVMEQEPTRPATVDRVDPAVTQARADLTAQLTAAIEAASTFAELKAAWELVPAPVEGKLTADQYNGLSSLTKTRRGQLETGASGEPATSTADAAPAPAVPLDEAGKRSNANQHESIVAGWAKLALDRPESLAKIAEIIDRTVDGEEELTFREAMRVLDWQTKQSWELNDQPPQPTQASKPDAKARTKMHALWAEIGYGGSTKVARDRRIAATSRMVGREIASSNDLTPAEIDIVIAGLVAKRDSDKAEAAKTAAEQREPEPELVGVGR